MKKEDLRILFLGNPEFAAESLKALVEGGYNIVGAVTGVDKPAGRGHQLRQSPVKQYAVAHHIPVLQPASLKDETFLSELRALNADLFIVIAFRMLPEAVWSMPPMGTFNLHASLLPKYRGAAPINWAVINGEPETGVTTFFLKHEIDTGDIIQQEKIAISPDDNVGEVHDRLMALGARLTRQTVDAIIDGTLHTTPQSKLTGNIPPTPAPKIFRETCQIDPTAPVNKIHDFVRGLSPYPGAWMRMVVNGNPTDVKILRSHRVQEPQSDSAEPAIRFVKYAGKTYLRLSNQSGALDIETIQIPGKKAMSATEAAAGHYSFKI